MALLLLAASVTTGHSQALERLRAPADTLSPAQELARLQARADSLALEWQRASALADMVDSLRHAPALSGWDTIRVGALRIISNRSPLPLRDAATRAWPVIDSLYGPDASQLARQPILVAAYDPDTTAPASRGTLQVPWDLDVTSLTLVLLGNIQIGPADTALRNWLSGTVRPGLLLERQRAAVYLQLVTAPSEVARRCFSGGIASCRDALGLMSAPDPVSRWYPSPAERRALVARTFPAFVIGPERSRLQRCLGGDDGACAEMLRALSLEALPKPLKNDARETLLHLALQVGGRAAYHRLMAAVDRPMAERLTVAAGISVDSLVTRWRAAVLAARPVPLTLPPLGVGISLGWVLCFALCALRSSRWRVS